MGNLLRIVLDLVEDPVARQAFRADPHATLDGIDDVCGEDVAAVVDVVRLQVEPGLAARLTEVLASPVGHHGEPVEAACRSLLALCDAVESVGAGSAGSREVPTRPPGPDRAAHLWAIDGSGGAANRDHDRRSAVPLAPVPDPPGGFEFAPLELVRLPTGLPAAGIEPGALATVVAVHREPELHYEIEVSGEDGGRRFLGTVPPSSLDRYTG